MPLIRRHYMINGIVQGVGFRPFVYRLAHELELSGWVRNSPAGVEIELQGSQQALAAFERALAGDAPPLAVIDAITVENIPTGDNNGFIILPSSDGEPDIQIAPDSATCPDCLRELFDSSDRRFRYPFITCTNCGPRYSIITGIPYDRPKTTMSGFQLCPECHSEYTNPLDRRFHAQPIACHACGPQLQLLAGSGKILAGRNEALLRTIELLKNGNIMAVKGIGGFHLAVDACNHQAVFCLRERKKRDEKPFAVMAANLEAARRVAKMNEMEERLLTSPESPIVIVRKRQTAILSSLIAPGNGWIGLMLPYSPLHHLLMRDNFQALVMTSANISDEPVAFEDDDAVARLAAIADGFLLHDRPIHIRSDDSVIRVFQGKPLFYRRARGYAPRAVTLPFSVTPLLAVGAELKNTICIADATKAVLSQHIGDLQNQSTFESFGHTIAYLSEILEIDPKMVVSDQHPDYLSTRYAEDSGLPLTQVQHHHAHLASCMAENSLDGDVIGIIFDGTGYGSDNTIWGGEFLTGGYDNYQRVGHFRPFPLPGGDAAVREPWRTAMAFLYQALGDDAFRIDHPVAKILPDSELELFAQMLRRGINSPMTSSCGRLFDAVAALLNVRHIVSYDGQAAIELEALAETAVDADFNAYPYKIIKDAGTTLQLDFSPMVMNILSDLRNGTKTSLIAHNFHQTISSAAVDVCIIISRETGLDRVVLSGGVFQNRLLTEMVYTHLTQKGLNVFTHRLVPPNDGGIPLGQTAIAGRRKI